MKNQASTAYEPSDIETKWQALWEEQGLYHADVEPGKPKHYALTMLPYPSGDLHIGHWYAIAPSDARARFKRMQGYNVMFPMGFDAFGLPAENAAIKNNIHPKSWTYANIARMEGQLKMMGTMIDWRRKAVSCDPEYYRWTQWFFLQFFKNNLAYRKQSPVDWCPSCNTTLAREQVWGDDRHCERCRTPVIKKDLEQWYFRTTRYADELLRYDSIDWPERVRNLQTNWIGRSEGATVTFKTEGGDAFDIFTTRPDTLWGVTFMVLAPEHPLVAKITSAEQKEAVEAYVAQAIRQTEVDRKATDKEKSGVFTGAYAINPVNGEKTPIWIADYVLMTYGTGAIMAVPAHDQRDFEFARTFHIAIKPVILPTGVAQMDPADMTEALSHGDHMVDSGILTGMPADDAIAKAIDHVVSLGCGERSIQYQLRDWLVSRQRYWGSPIPIVYCKGCGPVAVPEDQLPVTLPDDIEWRPTGESPLRLHPEWRFVDCPSCGAAAERETDTMDTFMCSSLYHLRYLSPHYEQGPFDPKEYDYWMPVDTYTGGIEHANMHLIYTRFFHKACRDLAITKGDEPMTQLCNQGIVLGEDGEKMSKSRGNVVAPDKLVDQFGTDTVRAYLMFFARWEQGGPWNSDGIAGAKRWLGRTWSIFTDPAPTGKASEATVTQLRRKLHQTLEQVTREFETFQFNTIVAALMELLNEVSKAREAGAAHHPVWQETASYYLRMLAPIAPHIAEEIWQRLGNDTSIHKASWPEFDAKAAKDDVITLVLQVNGKVRDKIDVPADIDKAEAETRALASENVQKFMDGKSPRKVIVVPGRLVNVVV